MLQRNAGTTGAGTERRAKIHFHMALLVGSLFYQNDLTVRRNILGLILAWNAGKRNGAESQQK